MVLKEKQALIITLCTLGACALLFFGGMANTWIFILPAALYIALTAYGSASIRSQMFVTVQSTLGGSEKQVCLSFDDGPHPNSLQVAAVLKEHGIRAVFFCIGKQVELYPDIVRQLHTEGHIIGNHSYSHSPVLNFYSGRQMYSEIKRTDTLIEQLCGDKCQWYRPPYGVSNHPLRYALKKLPHKVLGWNLRSLDTLQQNPEKLLQRVLRKVKPGSIILFHDNLPNTAHMLQLLIPELQRRGYSFALPLATQIFVKP